MRLAIMNKLLLNQDLLADGIRDFNQIDQMSQAHLTYTGFSQMVKDLCQKVDRLQFDHNDLRETYLQSSPHKLTNRAKLD